MLFSSLRSCTTVPREGEKTASTKVSATQFDTVSLNYMYQSMVYSHIFFMFITFVCSCAFIDSLKLSDFRGADSFIKKTVDFTLPSDFFFLVLAVQALLFPTAEKVIKNAELYSCYAAVTCCLSNCCCNCGANSLIKCCGKNVVCLKVFVADK